MPTKSRAEYMRNWRRKKKAEALARQGTPNPHLACDARERELEDNNRRLQETIEFLDGRVKALEIENRDLRELLPF